VNLRAARRASLKPQQSFSRSETVRVRRLPSWFAVTGRHEQSTRYEGQKGILARNGGDSTFGSSASNCADGKISMNVWMRSARPNTFDGLLGPAPRGVLLEADRKMRSMPAAIPRLGTQNDLLCARLLSCGQVAQSG